MLKKLLRNALLAGCMLAVMPQLSAAIITVSNNADAGAGSLRQAVLDANAGDTIYFGTFTNLGTTTLTTGEITLNKNLYIEGNGTALTVISGNNASRIFNVTNSANIILASLSTINGSSTANGGAILVSSGSLETRNSSILNSTAALSGGGIYLMSGTLLINNTSISNNTANGAMGTQGGGALAVASGSATITNSTLTNNDAGGVSGSGGAVLNSATLIITNTSITGNTASRAGGGIEDNAGAGFTMLLTDVTLNNNSTASNPGNGGGLHITGAGSATITRGTVNNNTAAAEGGGLWNGSGTMMLDSVLIDGNIASGAAADQGGGGIYNLSGNLMITNNTRITNNDADGTSGSGGGILVDVGGGLTMVGGEISDNTAVRAGGGIEDNSGSASTINITKTLFNNNSVSANPGNGGGIHITGPGDMNLISTTFTNNTASAEGGAVWNGSGTMLADTVTATGNVASGNGADQGGGAFFNLSGSLTISNSTLSNNSATGTSGSGGAVLNDVGATLILSANTISGNSANRAGGGVEDNSGATTTMNFSNNIFSMNSTGSAPGNGGGLHITGAGNVDITNDRYMSNTAAAEGGALWNGAGIMNVTGTRIMNNTASGNDPNQGGGGIFNLRGTVNVLGNTIIRNNIADGTSGSGGGILNDSAATLVVSNSTISLNSANRAGGGIEDNSGASSTVTLANVVLDSNSTASAPGNGGGIHITGSGDMNINNATLRFNTAAAEGGALWNGSGTMNVDSSYIAFNTASGNGADQGGGGIYNLSGTLNVNAGTEIRGNIADGTSGSGGGILNDVGGALFVTDAKIVLNTANRAGGGIEDNSGNSTTLNLLRVRLDSNEVFTSPGNGGGLHITGAGAANINSGTAIGNIAGAEGGAYWNGSGTMILDGTQVSSNVASGNDPNQGGGGVYSLSGNLTITNSLLTGNMANGTSGSGGAILIDSSASLSVRGSLISNNVASRAGGGIEDNSRTSTVTLLDSVELSANITGAAPGNGGGLHVTGSGDVTVQNSRINNNEAAAEGGGLWNGSGNMLVLSSEFLNNKASGNAADQGGGAIYNLSGSVTVTDADFRNNEADGTAGSGGAILTDAGTSLSVENASFSGNTSNRAGGAIEDNSGSTAVVTVVNSTFSQNVTGSAPGNGGAIHITGPGDMNIIGSKFNGNIASREGGALWNGSGTMLVDSVSIDNNIASGAAADDGGAGLFNNGGVVVVTRSSITNNSASGNAATGGGIHNNGGSVSIRYSTVSNNIATADGGGVFNFGTFSATASTIAANSAIADGGGIAQLLATDSITLSSTIVADNMSNAVATTDISGGLGVVTSMDFNLVGVADAGLFTAASGDLVGTAAVPIDAQLDVLSPSGAISMVHPLLCGSPAINAGNNADASLDQRGEAVFLGARDMGAFELQDSCSIGLDEASILAQANVYPNPVTAEGFTVNVPTNFNEALEIRIIDGFGRMIKTYDAQYQKTINIETERMPSGTYMVQMVSDNAVYTHKIVLL